MSVQAFALLYGIPFVFLCLSRRYADGLHLPQIRSHWLLLGLWLGVGVLLRLPFLWDSGFHYDTGTYKAWALKLSDPAQPLQIYQQGYFADYPPLYMYVLAALGWLARHLGLDNGAHFTALIKLPALLCDLAVASLIYRHTATRIPASGHHGLALLAASLYWLNPAIIFDSAVWGQTEAVLALLLVSAWIHWRQARLWAASLALGAAVAFKPQGLIFAYVYGLSLLISLPLRDTLRQALIGLGAFLAIIWPFAREQNLDWIFQLYFSTASTYDYLSVNAYNFWAIWGWNWAKDPGHWLGLPIQLWAALIAAAGLSGIAVRCGWQWRRSLTLESRGELAAWAFALAALLFFMFAPRMHERYIISLLPMLALLPHTPYSRLLMLLWSASSLANMGYVYHYYIELDEIAPASTPFLRGLAGINLALTLFSLMLWLRPAAVARLHAALRRGLQRLPALPQTPAPAMPRSRWQLAPYLVLGLAALVLGNFRLGSANYPQSGLSVEPGEILLHYASPVLPKRALIFAGEGQGKLKLEQAIGETWYELIPERELRDFYKLHEITLPTHQASRLYRIRVTAVDQPLRINEFGLLDETNQALVPSRVEGSLAGAHALVDEPGSWVPDEHYRSSSFFDEVYHARTAYEYLHRLPIYETTHPPMGKWLISQGIAHFGMTPWSMRITGVLATVGIVLALVWGGGLLGRSQRAMWLTGLLGLVEFSRFSIGRYSTIDSFLILFILLGALCLWQAFCRDTQRNWLDGWRLSPSLLLGGLSLGLAIATKWSALYFAIGVFAFFLWSLVRAAAPASQPDANPGRWNFSSWPRMITAAGLAFGLIPLLVYLFSYTPFLRCLPHAPELWSAEGLRQVWKSQVDMYNYHAHLDSTHAFSAAFYTWPLILKPLWLYVSETRIPLRSSITLMGNPLIWWTGLLALILLISRKLRWPSRDRIWLLASVTALYLPWTAVSRISFIYHYFPIVPFLILLLGVSLSRWPRQGAFSRALPWLFTGLGALLFALFYPAISGFAVPASWFKYLHWLPSWWML